MITKDLGPALAALREAGGMRQSAMASHLGMHQSTLSRFEAGDLAGDRDLYVRYLKHISTEPAQWAADALDVSWSYVQQPQLNHPNLGHLTSAERSCLIVVRRMVMMDERQLDRLEPSRRISRTRSCRSMTGRE